MNDYGYLVYDSDIENAQASISIHTLSGVFDKQTSAENIFVQHGATPKGYRDWASFEKGAFDFEKPIYTPAAWNYIPFATVGVSNERGWFTDNQGNDIAFLFTIFPNEPYTGDGFTLQTYYEEYEVYAKVIDSNGTRYENFKKTKNMQDEFFYLPYDELNQLQLYLKIPPYHFAKIISFGFGGTRLITDENLVEEPQFDHYFSLMSDELPLDTLSFRIFSDNNFKPVSGNKITNYITGQEFYVDTAVNNADNTITVNCYDGLAKRDVAFNGMMRFTTSVKNQSTLEQLFGDLPFNFDDETTGAFDTLTWAGTVSDDVTYREAIRMWLQGCTLALRKLYDQFVIVSPYNNTETAKVFDETDIVSIDFEALERYTRVHFSKHKFTVDKTNGLQEAFRDIVDVNSGEQEVLSFGAPFVLEKRNNSNLPKVYYIDNDETVHEADYNHFIVTQTGAYSIKATNSGYNDEEILLLGYPYKTSYTSIDYYKQISRQFKDNELMISDCTVALNVSNSAYRRRLEFYAKFDTVITLQSLKNYWAGDKVKVSVDNKNYEGFITHKTDNMNGVYSYEIEGYEVKENVA